MADGKVIMENATHGKTWTRTPTVGIVEVFLYYNGKRSPALSGYQEYWHSRGVVIDPTTGSKKLVADRIQGLREDGQWDTIEYDGTSYKKYIAPKAYGRPNNG